MADIRANVPWSDEIEALISGALCLDPLAAIEDDRDAVLNRRASLFGVYRGEALAGAFVARVTRGARADDFCIGAAASKGEGAPLTLEALKASEGFARDMQCDAVRAAIYNPRLFPVLRRAGYTPLFVMMRKEIDNGRL